LQDAEQDAAGNRDESPADRLRFIPDFAACTPISMVRLLVIRTKDITMTLIMPELKRK
jgi:hypothetical protein